MFTDLPKIFDRDFVIGYLLPSILLTVGTAIVFRLSLGLQIIDINWVANQNNLIILSVGNVDNAVFLLGLFALVCLVVAVTLLALNRALVRLLEGYLPPVSWFGFIAVWRYRKLLRGIEEISQSYIDEQSKGQVSSSTQKKYTKLLSQRVNQYPDNVEFVLPTKFGNVIRAAEVYPRILYGADIIPVWARLLSVVDEKYKENINGSRASVDFAVNIVYACVILLLEVFVLFSFSPLSDSLWMQYWYLPLAFAFGGYGSYHLAVSRAIEWGTFIKATSDLYLDDLLVKLGYDNVANNKKRKTWQEISRTFLYLEPLPKKSITRKK